MDLGLTGRVAVVTGASKGIGKAIARGLADEGVQLAILARDPSALAAAAQEIRDATAVRVLACPTDVREETAIANAVEQVTREFGAVHIIVNNAGGPIKRQDRQITWPDTDWLDDVNTKTLGMLRVTKLFLPLVPRDGTGRIINISGIAGSSVLGAALTHGLNNSAMNQVTTYLAKDLAAERITVNAIIPGLIATEWRQNWAEVSGTQQGLSRDEFLDQTCRNWGIVSGRWGTMEEVAHVVTFLASDKASYVNGARIAVDGGYTMNSR